METSIAFTHSKYSSAKRNKCIVLLQKNTDLAITYKKERHVFFTRSYKILLNAYK